MYQRIWHMVSCMGRNPTQHVMPRDPIVTIIMRVCVSLCRLHNGAGRVRTKVAEQICLLASLLPTSHGGSSLAQHPLLLGAACTRTRTFTNMFILAHAGVDLAASLKKPQRRGIRSSSSHYGSSCTRQGASGACDGMCYRRCVEGLCPTVGVCTAAATPCKACPSELPTRVLDARILVGIGAALAAEFLAKGCTVYASDIKLDNMAGLPAGIHKQTLDVTQPASIKAAVEQVGTVAWLLCRM